MQVHALENNISYSKYHESISMKSYQADRNRDCLMVNISHIKTNRYKMRNFIETIPPFFVSQFSELKAGRIKGF